ncbi:MAG TPA: deoxyribonuclease IV [Thermoanaerobaculia bacterium]|jgi:deoxyribonuclease-4
MARLGAHVSTAGGVARAIARGRGLGCEALQIFVKSPSQWRAPALAATEIARFAEERAAAGALPVVAHAAYLINLAAPDPAVLEKSRRALADELARAAALGLDGVVVHPGAHLGAGEAAGLDAVARSLDAVLADLPTAGPRLLLELTAGQGTVLGRTLGELRGIYDRAAAKPRLGFCLDTCHAFAGGHAIGSAAGMARFLDEADAALGLDRVACWHVNDSVGALGSRRDRHANIGEGEIGLDGFARLVADARLTAAPMILETPFGDDEQGHARDLAVLRRLVSRRPSSAPPASRRRSRGR